MIKTAPLAFMLGCASFMGACSQGDGKTQEIEISDGLDGQDGKAGNDGRDGQQGLPGVDGASGGRGPAGSPGSGREGPTGDRGADGLDGTNGDAGHDGTPGQDGAAGRDGVDGNHGRDGQDGRHGDRGSDGYGMDPIYGYRCSGGWTENPWHWDLAYSVVSYTTGHWWLRLEQSGSSVDREGLLWDGVVSIQTNLFRALWLDSERRVRFTHLSSGVQWTKDCEENQ